MGTGPEDIFIYFCHPAEMGFNMDRFHPPAVAAVYSGYGLDMPQNSEYWAIRAPAIMCHFIREIDGGWSSTPASGWATRSSMASL